ncbi:MAG TPA: hypothetical protein VLK27_01815 [Chthoniobacterales bacterium]|nr:hypothetical protein [Chthoniobacterales bacterium]
MAGLIFLGIGLACSLIGRILLIGAAFGVSVWWGIGVFLPFGPLLFRLSYPEVAPASRYFRLAAMPCFLACFLWQPTGLMKFDHPEISKSASAPAAPANHYAIEQIAQPLTEERKAANEIEFQRLKKWSEALRLKKRDLLHSDVPGNTAYDAEMAQYEAALAKAMTEKQALFGSAK